MLIVCVLILFVCLFGWWCLLSTFLWLWVLSVLLFGLVLGVVISFTLCDLRLVVCLVWCIALGLLLKCIFAAIWVVLSCCFCYFSWVVACSWRCLVCLLCLDFVDWLLV